jgi:nucleoside permease NupC
MSEIKKNIRAIHFQGAITAVFLVANIGASLIAVLAFIAFINGILVIHGGGGGEEFCIFEMTFSHMRTSV